jgi:hypothetical protein
MEIGQVFRMSRWPQLFSPNCHFSRDVFIKYFFKIIRRKTILSYRMYFFYIDQLILNKISFQLFFWIQFNLYFFKKWITASLWLFKSFTGNIICTKWWQENYFQRCFGLLGNIWPICLFLIFLSVCLSPLLAFYQYTSAYSVSTNLSPQTCLFIFLSLSIFSVYLSVYLSGYGHSSPSIQPHLSSVHG